MYYMSGTVVRDLSELTHLIITYKINAVIPLFTDKENEPQRG